MITAAPSDVTAWSSAQILGMKANIFLWSSVSSLSLVVALGSHSSDSMMVQSDLSTGAGLGLAVRSVSPWGVDQPLASCALKAAMPVRPTAASFVSGTSMVAVGYSATAQWWVGQARHRFRQLSRRSQQAPHNAQTDQEGSWKSYKHPGISVHNQKLAGLNQLVWYIC